MLPGTHLVIIITGNHDYHDSTCNKIYKAPEKQRPDGAAGAFGTGDTGGRYSTGTVVALSLSVQDRIPTAVRPALFPYPIH